MTGIRGKETTTGGNLEGGADTTCTTTRSVLAITRPTTRCLGMTLTIVACGVTAITFLKGMNLI